MILLDSDHLTVLRYRVTDRAIRLAARLASATKLPIGTTVANVEEVMRGWLAAVAKERDVRRQVHAYRELAELFGFFAGFHIALFDDAAASRFEALTRARGWIGTMDLKTASIALASGSLLLTANRRHFEKVPGLRIENWMEATA